jgi:hypothetical protein
MKARLVLFLVTASVVTAPSVESSPKRAQRSVEVRYKTKTVQVAGLFEMAVPRQAVEEFRVRQERKAIAVYWTNPSPMTIVVGKVDSESSEPRLLGFTAQKEVRRLGFAGLPDTVETVRYEEELDLGRWPARKGFVDNSRGCVMSLDPLISVDLSEIQEGLHVWITYDGDDQESLVRAVLGSIRPLAK